MKSGGTQHGVRNLTKLNSRWTHHQLTTPNETIGKSQQITKVHAVTRSHTLLVSLTGNLTIYPRRGRRGPLQPVTSSCGGFCSYCCSANSRRSSSRLPYFSHLSNSVAFKTCCVAQIWGNFRCLLEAAAFTLSLATLTTTRSHRRLLRESWRVVIMKKVCKEHRLQVTAASHYNSLSLNLCPSFTSFQGGGCPVTAFQESPASRPSLYNYCHMQAPSLEADSHTHFWDKAHSLQHTPTINMGIPQKTQVSHFIMKVLSPLGLKNMCVFAYLWLCFFILCRLVLRSLEMLQD